MQFLIWLVNCIIHKLVFHADHFQVYNKHQLQPALPGSSSRTSVGWLRWFVHPWRLLPAAREMMRATTANRSSASGCASHSNVSTSSAGVLPPICKKWHEFCRCENVLFLKHYTCMLLNYDKDYLLQIMFYFTVFVFVYKHILISTN